MCGITGSIAFTEKGKGSLHKISASTYCLQERGPDGEGIYFHNNAALGHRRLSIIDTSSAASQPFRDESGRYAIVFNGEIFNFRELKGELERQGQVFRSHSDTEVLLRLFIRDGKKCLERLDGEFAFAIYDERNEELFLARDRFGIKPLYYYRDKDRFVFASQMKAITAFDVPKQIDSSSLRLYFHLNYIPSPWSIFENVLKLEPGTWMTVDRNAGISSGKYYELKPGEKPVLDYENAKKKLRELLERSIQKRMIADVPLGTFLSGGIDSSIITAIASRNTKHLKSFSIGYRDEPLFDETKYARILAKKYGTEHTVFELSNEDLFGNLNTVLDHTDEPFADSSALAVNILSMHTRKHVKVALSGDGADELFSGYNKHLAEFKVRQNGLAARLVKSSHGILKQIPKSRNTKAGNTVRQLEKFAEGMKMDPRDRYWNWAKWSGFGPELFTEKYRGESSEKEFSDRRGKILGHISEDFNSVLYTDVRLVLEGDMLVKVDRMSMSQSLEVRVPFLNHEIVDLAFSLPADHKINEQQKKRILKESCSDLLPEELLKRGKKGFEVPLLKWFRTQLRSVIEELLDERFILEQGIFEPEEIRRTKERLFSPDPNDSVERIWALIVFQYWFKKFYS